MSEKLGLKKQREQRIAMLESPGSDSWAIVELYRWQHGELPPQNGSKPLDKGIALKNMAAALSERNPSKWPTPFNIAAVLAYCSRNIKDPVISC